MKWQTCLEYITRSDADAHWQLVGKADQVWITKWQSSVDQPTQAELQSVEATAIAWKENAENEAIYEGDTGKLIQAALVCLKAENPTLKLPTKAEVIAKFKQIKDAQ